MKKYIKASGSQGFVGIWWITDDNYVFGKAIPVEDGQVENVFSQCKENHLNYFKEALFDNFNDEIANEYYKLGYKGLERGRVIFDYRTLSFIITCSEEIYQNLDARKAIIEAYDLYGKRYDFDVISHYKKLPLTGNPAVDAQIYELD